MFQPSLKSRGNWLLVLSCILCNVYLTIIRYQFQTDLKRCISMKPVELISYINDIHIAIISYLWNFDTDIECLKYYHLFNICYTPYMVKIGLSPLFSARSIEGTEESCWPRPYSIRTTLNVLSTFSQMFSTNGTIIWKYGAGFAIDWFAWESEIGLHWCM